MKRIKEAFVFAVLATATFLVACYFAALGWKLIPIMYGWMK